MLRKVVKVRIYPTDEQCRYLAKSFGCDRWWWNYALNQSIEVYKQTGKGLGQSTLNAMLPGLKQEHEWLGECYSQVLQARTLNLTNAYKNFFEKRGGFPKFKSKHGKQSIQYPQKVQVISDFEVKFPGRLGIVKARVHRPVVGKIKTVTVSQSPSGKYFAAILFEVEGEHPETSTKGKVIGVESSLRLTDGFPVLKLVRRAGIKFLKCG